MAENCSAEVLVTVRASEPVARRLMNAVPQIDEPFPSPMTFSHPSEVVVTVGLASVATMASSALPTVTVGKVGEKVVELLVELVVLTLPTRLRTTGATTHYLTALSTRVACCTTAALSIFAKIQSPLFTVFVQPVRVLSCALIALESVGLALATMLSATVGGKLAQVSF